MSERPKRAARPVKLNVLNEPKDSYTGGKSSLCPGCGHDQISNVIISAAWENGIEPKHIGLMAQDLQAIEPLLVNEIEFAPGYYRIEYNQLNVLLIEAIKNLNTRAESIKQTLGMSAADTFSTTTKSATWSYNPIQYELDTLGAKGANFTINITETNHNKFWCNYTISGNISISDFNNESDFFQLDNEMHGNVNIKNGTGSIHFDFKNSAWNVGKNLTITLWEKDSEGISTSSQSITIQLQD
mgnify:CR=1 FL=1